MSGTARSWLIAVCGIATALLLIVLGGLLVLRSNWLHQQIKQRVIAEIERSTGGKAELREFHFDPGTLTVEANGLVIHGTEGPGEAPLLSIPKLKLGLKLVSFTKRQVDLNSVQLFQPQVHVMISADGRTNIPAPRTPLTRRRLDEAILDLAIGRFVLDDGTANVEVSGKPPALRRWSIRGENLKAHFAYASARYSGKVSAASFRIGGATFGPIDSAIDLPLVVERDHMQVTGGEVRMGSSSVEFSGDLRSFADPTFSGTYTAHLAANDAGRWLEARSRQSGTLDATGSFRFHSVHDYAISGKLRGSDLTYLSSNLRVEHAQVASDFSAGAQTVEATNLQISWHGGRVRGSATLSDSDRFAVRGTVEQVDAADLARSLRFDPARIDFRASGPFEANGSLRELRRNRFDASARLTLSSAGNTPVSGLVDVHLDGVRQYADFGKSFLALRSSRVDFSGGLGIQKGTFEAQLQVRAATNNLDDASSVFPSIGTLPVSLHAGHAGFEGTVSGSLRSPAVAGHVTANNIVIEKQSVEAFSADVHASESQLQLANGVLAYQNLRLRIAGSIGLQNWKPVNQSAVNLTASIQNGDLANLLALTGQTQLPLKGSMTADGKVTGTIADPRTNATLRAASGTVFGEPFDRAILNAAYGSDGRQQLTGEIVAGTKKLNLAGTFQHAPADFLDGTIQANFRTNDLALNQIRSIRDRQPSIGGTGRLTADGELRLIHGKTGEHVELLRLNADVLTRKLSLDEKELGDLHLTAKTSSASQAVPQVDVQIESNLAHSTIRGGGRWQLAGDYPGSGEVTFTGVNLAEVRKLFAPNATSLSSLGGAIEGRVSFSGPAERPQSMTGVLEIPRLEIRPEPGGKVPIPATLRDLVIRNQGPLRLVMTNGNVRVETARVTARSTDLSLTGAINLNSTTPLNLRASGNLDLSILPMFERDLVSSGTVAATATIRGAFRQPDIVGRLDIRNANLNLEGLPNGLSNANGTVIFDPSRATIQSLSAETGGGKVNLTGFVAFSNGPMVLRLEAAAKDVRVRYPEGVSTVADANLRLIGTSERSTLSGKITIERSALMLNTDIGSLLANATAPVQTPSAQTGLVGNMQFDVDVVTAPDVTLQTSLAQGLQADASLRLRGTLSNPVLLGRINVSQGELMFFGNKYTINQGTISFFNPVKLEPVLDVSLETRARGVDVTINVTGPITKLNVSYRSDPPLQFADLVALLATGRTPENPTIAARETGTSQTWQEMGASALLGEAIANPMAGRLQRFFGVSKIKIDPLLTGVAGNAQARLTIEQNVTPDLTFTYITNVASSTGSAQVIRVEWDFSRHWSAVAVRDEYGYFGMDFQYRKRLK